MRAHHSVWHPILISKFSCRLVFAFGLSVLITLSARAQSIQYTQNKSDQTLHSAMRIDPSTLGVSIEVPLGGYAGRASLPISLSYASKQWRIDFYSSWTNNWGEARTESHPKFSEWAKAGWTSSLDLPVIEWTGHNQVYNSDGYPYCVACVDSDWSDQLYINRLQVHMPGGSSHELRTDDTAVGASSLNYAGTYYAVDGSNLRYEANSSGEGTLYLPDGSRYLLLPSSAGYQYIDRNGNTLSYSASNRQWTDTQGRVLDVPMPASPTAQTYTYNLPSTTSTPFSYSVRWANLGDALTNSSDALRYQTGQLPYYGGGDGVTGHSPYLFNGTFINRLYDFSGLFNPVVPAEIVLPNGQSYLFTYNVWGEITKVVYPTGGYERFDYAAITGTTYLKAPYAQANRGVVDRWLSPTGNSGEEVHWHYATGYVSSAYTVSTTEPDGTLMERLLYAESTEGTSLCGFSNILLGMAYEERVSAPSSAGGAILRRTLTDWTTSGPTSGGWWSACRNQRVTKQVSILLDTGTSNALTSTTTMSYDDDLNVIATNHYDFTSISQSSAQTSAIGSISAGSLLRTEEATFLVNDTAISSTTRTAYRNRNLLSLPTSTRVKDSSGTVVAQSQTSYDETSSYPLLTYSGTISGWTDPSTNIRGLATTTGVWLNTTSSYLQTHAQYDQLGNVRNTWDALGNESQVTYSSTYSYAYPTSATTAAPDSTGAHGSTTGLTTSAIYNSNTGLMTSLTDANGQTTSYSYDSINRLSTITRPSGGGSTSYAYGDSPSNLYVRTQTSIDSSRVVEAYQYFDKLGRACRTFLNEGSTYSTTDTQYDSMGRVWRVSNPYRTTSLSDSVNPSGNWTTNAYDALGRVLTVTTPDSAVVTSAYSGSTAAPVGTVVTVTDQAGKARKSVTDGLGRLTTVYEDPASLNYSTSYSYDTLDDLTTVTQGSQTRSFAYDSLKRLTSAANPESGTVSYAYDNNGNLTSKTDARSITATYTYDAINRAVTHSYSDGTPTVTYNYDNATNGKGRLTSVSSSVSTTNYTGYDALGRITSANQVTDSQTYSMSYAYNLAGSPSSITYPSGRVILSEYDGAGRLAGVRDQQSSVYYAGGASTDATNRMQYAAHGAVSVMKLGNGLWEHTGFNNRLQPTEIGLGTSSTDSSTMGLSYSYGTTSNNGNLQSVSYSGGGLSYTQNFGYDALNRLTTSSENSGSSWSQTNGYDQFGNRWIDLGGGNQNLTFSTSTNRITTSGYIYDAAGNLTNDSIHSYGFDAENKIKAVDGVGGVYNYDGDGNRVRKNFALGEQVRMVYSGGQLLAEYDLSTGALKKEYIYGAKGLIATIEPSTGTRYTTSDHLGSPRVVTNSSAGVVSRHDYMPFGEELGLVGGRTTGMGYSTADGLRQKFTQKERDNETGLDFFEARYYASTQGRFTSVDPYNIVMETQNATDKKEAQKQFTTYLSDPRKWNRYAYCLNNPLLYTDPNGEEVIIYYRPPSDNRKLGPLPDQGHFLIYVRNDKTGESAYFDYWVNTKTGETTLGEVTDKRLSEHASLTIQSTPEQEQAILGGIKSMQNGAPNYCLTPIGPRSGIGNVSECTNNAANLLKLGGINIRFDEKFFPTDAWNSLVRQYAPQLIQTEIVDVGDRGGWRRVTSVPTPTVGQSYGNDPRGQARRVDPNAINNRELHFRNGKRLN